MLNAPPRLLDLAGDLPVAIARDGYALASPAGIADLACLPLPDAATTQGPWNALPPDGYLLDGGHYRRRRHASLILDLAGTTLITAPQRAHWQPLDYNALHGGLERWYEPIEARFLALPFIRALITRLGQTLATLKPVTRWFIEAHQFRIDTTGGIGRPTPEGAHRDGVDFVAVILVERHSVRGGETRVFETGGPHGLRFTLATPWTALLLDDARVIHETSPVQPLGPSGYRDTLVLTWRADGFMGP